MKKYPTSVYDAARARYLANYPRTPFGNPGVVDFAEYLAYEYEAWYDRNFMYAMGIEQETL